eukprot:TRINITY_DN1823_c1_g3_i1.p1 TRINITY_DN1823_c1_g3~~TRINITY_DN1823_c1_g3_i1.p1  ORF type:complete len:457 (-),score=129.84 TRINITY_DN1823_c1_g3_i1:64-1434(-)
MKGGRAILCFVVFVTLALVANGGIIRESIENDPRQTIFFGIFGFASGGKFDLSVKNLKVKSTSSSSIDLEEAESTMGFVVQLVPYRNGIIFDDLEKKCPIYPSTAVDYHTLAMAEGSGLSFVVPLSAEGYYATYFVNCKKDLRVSFDVEIIEFNRGPDYLPVGQKPLPILFFIAGLINSGVLTFWLIYMKKKRQNVFRIHFVMAIVLLLKVLFLFVEAARLKKIQQDGEAPFLNAPYYIFEILESTMLFIAILLIGTGWSFMKPFLHDREKTILKVVLPLQLIADIAIIVTGELAPSSPSFVFWNDISRIVDIVCCCVVLFPIVWSIRHLKEGGNVEGKQGATLKRLEAFRTFYIATVIYIYFTRIVIVLLRSVLSFRNEWYADLVSEIASLIFYVLVGYQFRPVAENPYIQLSLEDDDGVMELDIGGGEDLEDMPMDSDDEGELRVVGGDREAID